MRTLGFNLVANSDANYHPGTLGPPYHNQKLCECDIFFFHNNDFTRPSCCVFQGSSVFPRLWSDARVWPGVWPCPTTDHSPQPSIHARNKPKPHAQLSHSVEVLLQRQLWLEGILWGETLQAHEHEATARHINSGPTSQLSSSWDEIDRTQTSTHAYPHICIDTPYYNEAQLFSTSCNLFHQINKDWLVSIWSMWSEQCSDFLLSSKWGRKTKI